MEYKFYLQKADSAGKAVGSPIDLEEAYPGLRYLSCEGLETIGKVKNIETESYAESDSLRVWHPSDNNLATTHEATDVTLNLVFLGSTRRNTLRKFRELIYSGRLFYMDTARHLRALLVLQEEQTVTEDSLKGIGYIQQGFKFSALWGKPEDYSSEMENWCIVTVELNAETGKVTGTSEDGWSAEQLIIDQLRGELQEQWKTVE